MNARHLRPAQPWSPGPLLPGHRPGGQPGTPHPYHRPHYHGFCHSCCHPLSLCCCGYRECRKEAKELLATPGEVVGIPGAKRDVRIVRAMRLFRAANLTEFMAKAPSGEETVESPDPATVAAAGIRQPLVGMEIGDFAQEAGVALAFIGGGCCVHLSIEYMPSPIESREAEESVVVVGVVDSEDTALVWGKSNVQPGYYIKEGIITTNPGAVLGLIVSNAVARVRWCEVFSC